MASTIKIKNGTSGAPSSLVQGELAIDTSIGKLFHGTAGGTAVSSSFTFTDITASGKIIATEDISTDGIIYTDDIRRYTGNSTTTRIQMSGNNINIFAGSATNSHIKMVSTVGTVFNEGGSIGYDFRVEGDTDTHLFFIDAGADKVAIGTDTVSDSLLTVDGDITATHITSSGTISASGMIQTAGAISSSTGVTASAAFFSGNITSSGNISASGGSIWANFPDTNDDAVHYPIIVTGQNSIIESQNTLSLNPSTDSVEFAKRKIEQANGTDGNAKGADVVYFGSTTSMTTGAIYHYKSDGTWELADADAASTSDGLLAVALGAASDTNGMLLRGMVTLDHDPGAVGDVLYLSTTAGDATSTAPSGNGDIVRIIGYCLHASNGNIWFNPDNTFVEVTA
jgi:hypothetical protein